MSQLRDSIKLFGVFKISEGEIFEICVNRIFRDGLIVKEGVLRSDSLAGQFELHQFLALLILIF
jgi:hypothetical protein